MAASSGLGGPHLHGFSLWCHPQVAESCADQRNFDCEVLEFPPEFETQKSDLGPPSTSKVCQEKLLRRDVETQEATSSFAQGDALPQVLACQSIPCSEATQAMAVVGCALQSYGSSESGGSCHGEILEHSA